MLPSPTEHHQPQATLGTPGDVPGDSPPGPAGPVGRGLAWLLLIGGLIGTGAAFVLSVEKIALLKDPAFVPSCNLNPVLSCGSIMETGQAEVFGFPNPLIGLGGFPVLVVTGAALLAGARFARWYWLGLQAGVTLAVVFVGWLIFQSLYRIGALCPYCMLVWAVVIPTFWYVTLTNLRLGHLGAIGSSAPARTANTNHAVVLTCVAVTILGLITHRFWDYWVSVVS